MKWRCFLVIQYEGGLNAGGIELRRLGSNAAYDAPHGYVDCECDKNPRQILLNAPHIEALLDLVGGDFES